MEAFRPQGVLGGACQNTGRKTVKTELRSLGIPKWGLAGMNASLLPGPSTCPLRGWHLPLGPAVQAFLRKRPCTAPPRGKGQARLQMGRTQNHQTWGAQRQRAAVRSQVRFLPAPGSPAGLTLVVPRKRGSGGQTAENTEAQPNVFPAVNPRRRFGDFAAVGKVTRRRSGETFPSPARRRTPPSPPQRQNILTPYFSLVSFTRNSVISSSFIPREALTRKVESF